MPLSKNTPTGTVIHDIVHSKNARFKNDSKQKRIKRALAIAYRLHNEEVMNVEEGNKENKESKRDYVQDVGRKEIHSQWNSDSEDDPENFSRSRQRAVDAYHQPRYDSEKERLQVGREKLQAKKQPSITTVKRMKRQAALKKANEEVMNIEEGNKENKIKKNDYVADRGWRSRIRTERGNDVEPRYGYRYLRSIQKKSGSPFTNLKGDDKDKYMGMNYKGDKKEGRRTLPAVEETEYGEETEMKNSEMSIIENILAEGPSELVNAIANENEEAHDIFNDVMGAKIDVMLNNLKNELAAGMFEEPEEEEEITTEEFLAACESAGIEISEEELAELSEEQIDELTNKVYNKVIGARIGRISTDTANSANSSETARKVPRTTLTSTSSDSDKKLHADQESRRAAHVAHAAKVGDRAVRRQERFQWASNKMVGRAEADEKKQSEAKAKEKIEKAKSKAKAKGKN